MSYMQSDFSQLDDERQKHYLLIIDEVYVNSILLYHGGILFGKAVSKPNKPANAVLSFMLKSCMQYSHLNKLISSLKMSGK